MNLFYFEKRQVETVEICLTRLAYSKNEKNLNLMMMMIIFKI